MTHTSTEQPEALRLADALRDGEYSLYQERAATEAELRRLHARVQELEAQVQRAAEVERAAILERVKNRAVAGALLVEDFRFIVADRGPAAPVPQGWKLVPVELLERIQESLGSFVSDQGWSQSDMDTADALDGLLAAAPQPPEAAPVELPEPDAWMATPVMQSGRGATTVFCSDKRMADQWDYGGHPEYGRMLVTGLFTEQQVRDLLAAHGIGKDKA